MGYPCRSLINASNVPDLILQALSSIISDPLTWILLKSDSGSPSLSRQKDIALSMSGAVIENAPFEWVKTVYFFMA